MKVDLHSTDWIIVIAAMRQGIDDIPNERLGDDADGLIDEIIRQADITDDDLRQLNEDYESN